MRRMALRDRVGDSARQVARQQRTVLGPGAIDQNVSRLDRAACLRRKLRVTVCRGEQASPPVDLERCERMPARVGEHFRKEIERTDGHRGLRSNNASFALEDLTIGLQRNKNPIVAGGDVEDVGTTMQGARELGNRWVERAAVGNVGARQQQIAQRAIFEREGLALGTRIGCERSELLVKYPRALLVN